MVQNIVRPPRKIYTDQDLNLSFISNRTNWERNQYDVLHPDHKSTKLTIFSPQNYQEDNNSRIVILYLHSNASNKLEAAQLLQSLHPFFLLANFDFFGCGRDFIEGYLTLGIREAEQTDIVVKWLKQRKYKVVIWGRSMGAVTGILCGNADIIVVDSPYLTFQRVCKNISLRYTPRFLTPLIYCLFPCLFSRLRRDIQKSADYDVKNLNSFNAVKNLTNFSYCQI